MKFRSLVTSLVLVTLPNLASAAPVVRTITLEECLREAFQNNLDIKIVRYLPELAELNLEGTYAAYDPTFSFEYGADKRTQPGQSRIDQVKAPPNLSWSQDYAMGLGGLLPTGADYRLFGNMSSQRTKFFDPITESFQYQDPSLDGRMGVELTQPLLRNMWIDQTRWAIEINTKALLQDEQTVRNQLILTATDVQIAYYNLAASKQNIVVQEEAVQLAERLLLENKKRVEVGAMAPLEEKQAESQLATSRADLISAQQTYGTTQNALRRLLTADYGDLAETIFEPGDKFVPQPYPFSRVDSWSKGLTMRPDIVQSQLEMAKANVTVRYRRNQLFPQLDITGVFSSASSANDLSTSLEQLSNTEFKSYGVGARLLIPLGNRAARSSFSAAKIERERLILRHKLLEQNIMVAVDNAILVAQSAFERIQATKQARIYAEAALDAEQKKLENGKSTTFEVLQLQRDLTSARRDEIRALLDYFAAMTLLFRDEGSTLERLGVRVTTN